METVTLHGPELRPLTFNWKQVDGEWVQDWSMYVPQTIPVPLFMEDFAKLQAAEAKRARKPGKP